MTGFILAQQWSDSRRGESFWQKAARALLTHRPHSEPVIAFFQALNPDSFSKSRPKEKASVLLSDFTGGNLTIRLSLHKTS